MISTSPIKISCVIAAERRARRRSARSTRPSSSARTPSTRRTRRASTVRGSRRAALARQLISMARDGYRVGVVGATGAVGSTMLEVLAERDFPASEVVAVRLRALGRQAGPIRGRRARVPPALRRVDPGPRPGPLLGRRRGQRRVGTALRRRRARWSSTTRASGACTPDVPLVVAEVNPDAVERHNGLIANPNCSTMQMVVALAPIQRTVGIERIVVSTYQSVSGTGQRAIDELTRPGARRARTAQDAAAPRSIRTGSPSTCCPRSRRSRTATTTRPRSAS